LLQDHINTLATDKEYKEQYYPSQRTEQQEQPLPLTSTIAIKNDSDAEKESKYSVSSSASLMTSMVKRLRHVEGIVQEKQVRLAEKDEEIERLQREIHLLKRPGATGRNSQADLTTENRRLQKKIKEMEKFLEDYGLIWVGEQDPHNVEDTQTDENDEVEEEILPSYEESTSSSPVTMSDEDFDLLIRKIQELNALINQNEGTCTFVADRSKGNGKFHRLVPSKVDHIPCTIYLNGLFLKRGPLRSFEEPSTQDFIKDILDGFFPTDFKDEFPQGVIFDIQDKRKETYEDKAQINKPKRKINSLAALGEPNVSKKKIVKCYLVLM
jgi:hypothetical protein